MRRGFTVAEVVVSVALTGLVLWAVLSMFISGKKSQQTTTSSYLVSKDAEVAMRWLRSDLQETALGTVRIYPNEDSPSAAPGISMASARNLDEEFKLNDLGAPAWSTYIYYTLNADGELTRWSEEHDFKGIPVASEHQPDQIRNSTESRVVLHGLCQPGQELPGLEKLSERGGLDLQFVRHDQGKQLLSSLGPGQKNPGAGRATRLLSLKLTVAASTRKGKESYVQLPIRVWPRH